MYKLAHLGIVVRNCELSADFYSKILGCKVIANIANEQLKFIYLQSDELTIELLEYLEAPPFSRQAGVYDHLAFSVPDIQAAINSLNDQGIKFLSDTPRMALDGKRIIFFTGPDGERIELVEDNSQKEPGN